MMKPFILLLIFVGLVGIHLAGVCAEDNQPTGAEVSKDAVHATLEGLAEGSGAARGRQKMVAAKHPMEIKLKKTGMVFRLIPAGEFMMDSLKEENGRDDDDVQKKVKVEKPFYLGKFD